MDWSGIGNAPVFERGTAWGPGGHFKGALVRALVKDSQQSGMLFIVESKVLESTHPLNPVGSNATWIQSFKNRTVAFSAIKAWVCALVGLDPTRDKAKIEAELAPHLPVLMQDIVDKGSLNGRTFALATVPIWTKEQRPFLRHDFSAWEPSEGWTPEPTPSAPPYVDPSWLGANQSLGRAAAHAPAPAPGYFAPGQPYAGAPPGVGPNPNAAPPAPNGAPFDPLAILRR